MEYVECTMWVLVDEDGDFVVAKGADDLKELYEENYCELGDLQTRLVKIVVKVPRPRPVEVEVAVADLPQDVTVKAA